MARHPLQRVAAPSRQFSLLLHLAGIASFAASFRFLETWDTPMGKAYGGHYQFLTILGLSFAMATFVVGALADLTLSSQLFAAKNALSTFATPLEVLVSVLYWGLCAIDKSLVMPPEFTLDFLPDFGFHAAPAIFLALDMLLLSPPWAIRGYTAMALSQMLAFGYWYWVEHCFSKNGWYPYPIFDILSIPQRAMLFALSALIMTGSSAGLKWVYGKVNGYESLKREAVGGSTRTTASRRL
ncbi:FAR-17a/AIG1-like protein [Microdochium bolleyi]|uniref:FAR-17a/AIG1-like protein n=1 Tax=Microdochium bolleyi TaxID=196109 RepID=A0A136J403_9PEZI|nr:FAR-17a/AIG1-like protein [Microdochium bolleyi]